MSEFSWDDFQKQGRRTDALWKACEGVSTEALEAGIVAEMIEALKNLTAPQRDWYSNKPTIPATVVRADDYAAVLAVLAKLTNQQVPGGEGVK